MSFNFVFCFCLFLLLYVPSQQLWSLRDVWLVGFVALRPKSTAMVIAGRLVGWFCCFTSQVNSYGHCGTFGWLVLLLYVPSQQLWSLRDVWLVGFVALRPKSTAMVIAGRLVGWFCCFTSQVNSYGHCGTFGWLVLLLYVPSQQLWSLRDVWLVGFVALRPKSTAMVIAGRLVGWFCCFTSQVNSFGHCGTFGWLVLLLYVPSQQLWSLRDVWLVGFVALRPKSIAMVIAGRLVGWFCCFTSQVNSYGHCGTFGWLISLLYVPSQQLWSLRDVWLVGFVALRPKSIAMVIAGRLVGWFCCFTSQVNSYGHCGTFGWLVLLLYVPSE